MDEYRFDFDQVAAASRGTRKKPVLAVAELDKAVPESMAGQESGLADLVKFHAYEGGGELRLRMTDAEVRTVLRKLRFSSPVHIRFGENLVPCGVPIYRGEAAETVQGARAQPLAFKTVRAILHEGMRTICVSTRYQVGDTLWIREPAAKNKAGQWCYAADFEEPFKQGLYFGKPFHMQHEACRLHLQVLDVVEAERGWNIRIEPILLGKEVQNV